MVSEISASLFTRGVLTAAGFATAALAVGAAGEGFAAVVLEFGLGCFTITFDVAMGVGLVGGLAVFLVGAATFGVAFLLIALPGRLAALLGFFEGI
jgi:hypothetical protein